MAMERGADEALRSKGWSYFRSSTRDRVVPGTGLGAHLSRIKINSAFPVTEVEQGVAISLEERAAIEARRSVPMKPLMLGGASPMSATKYLAFLLNFPLAGAAVFHDEQFLIGVAPFDGFVTEIQFISFTGVLSTIFAVRTSGGGTFCASRSNIPVVPGTGPFPPDFFNILRGEIAGPFVPITVLRSNMPVLAGEEIYLITRTDAVVGPLANFVQGVVGVQSSAVEAAVSRRVRESTLLQREARAIERARVELAAAKHQVPVGEREEERRKAVRVPPKFPFGGRVATAVQSRAPQQPTPPRVVRAPKAVPEGTGKTFVSSWMPQAGSIGYLIPDPPRGGRVNVFDNKYSVFDITGKLIDQGQIEVIRADWEIPPGARLSANRSVSAAPAEIRTAAEEAALLRS
ncbi:MAG: hypothetical protein ACREU0_01735 [Burkholderiales bacterium]